MSKKSPTIFSALKNNDISTLRTLLLEGEDVNSKDADGRTPLHLAAFNGHLDGLRELITSGADVNVLNRDGNTPLHMTIRNDSMECIRALISAGADVNAKNNSGNTPLHLAAAHGFLDCMRLLIESGADLLTNEDKKTPKDLAYDYDNAHPDCLEWIENYERVHTEKTLIAFDTCLSSERLSKKRTSLKL